MVAGWTWTLARPVFCFFLLPSLLLGYCPYISLYNDLVAGKTDTPFFFLEGTNGL